MPRLDDTERSTRFSAERRRADDNARRRRQIANIPQRIPVQEHQIGPFPHRDGAGAIERAEKRSGIARLNASGSLDSTFDPGTGVGHDNFFTTYWVSSVILESEGIEGPPYWHLVGDPPAK